MTHRVSVQRTAKLDMLEACRWISRDSARRREQMA